MSRWRSKSGWNVIAGFNDKIKFEGGGETTIPAGNYATTADLRLAIDQAVMEARAKRGA
jgi:hypothetical protein